MRPNQAAAGACRYMRVYNATIKDRAFTYAIFFLFFSVHIIFCVWSAISPPLPFSNDWSHTGFICGIKAFGSNTFTGIIYVIGGSLWTLESLWSLWCLKGVRTMAFLPCPVLHCNCSAAQILVFLFFEGHDVIQVELACDAVLCRAACLPA